MSWTIPRFWKIYLALWAATLLGLLVGPSLGLFQKLSDKQTFMALLVPLLFLALGLLPLKLPTRILIALFFGAFAGLLIGPDIRVFEPVGKLFIRLIFMVVVPLVFASLFVGTASLGDIKKLGRIGARTVVFYLGYTALSGGIGLLLANVLEPGSGLGAETQSQILASYSEQAQNKVSTAQSKPSAVDTLLDIVPTNPLTAAAGPRPKMLQIIFFAMFMGVAILFVSTPRKDAVVTFFEGVNDAMIVMVHFVIKLAPYGVFALIAAVVGQFGFDILVLLTKYTVITCLGLVLLNFTYAPLVSYLTKVKTGRFLRGVWPAQGIAFSTSSSSATLPVTIECCTERLGVSKAIASFVLPLGATINMNGTALYQGISAVFIAQVYGIPLSALDQLAIVLTATLASIGTAGVPGVGMMMLVIVLQQTGVPVEGIALVLGVERILDMFRTTVNITGDAAAAVVVAHLEGELSTPG